MRIDNDRESLFNKSISAFASGLYCVSSDIPISVLNVGEIGWMKNRRHNRDGSRTIRVLQVEPVKRISDNVPRKGHSLSRLGAYDKTIPLSKRGAGYCGRG